MLHAHGSVVELAVPIAPVVTRVFAVSGCLIAIAVVARRPASGAGEGTGFAHRLGVCPTRVQDDMTDT
jgi:hypothetical protein